MKRYLEVFRKIQREVGGRFLEREGLVCKVGMYDGCAVLKLQKKGWTNDAMREVRNESGVFFSVWVTTEGAAEGRVFYNVHALKMRGLEGFRVTSREFAGAFRERFLRRGWPHVSVEFGPQTLMEGWIGEEDLEEGVVGLMERFLPVSRVIDELLEERREGRGED